MIYAIEDIRLEDEELLLNSLPEWRREEAMRYRHAQGRVECAQSYLLLCRMLSQQFGIVEPPTFVRDEHGKPHLQDNELHFSISHCRHAVAVVVDTHPCGIDIEIYGRGKDSLIRYTMNDAEQAQIEASDDPDATFVGFWTQKEAVCKAQGTGITNNLKEVLEQQIYQVQTQRYENYAVSIAFVKE